MKIALAYSRKFFPAAEEVKKACEAAGIQAAHAGTPPETADTPEGERDAVLRAFKNIDDADLLYVIAEDGYIGRAVALEIGYAYAKKKNIVTSETLGDLNVRTLVTDVVSKEGLISFLRKQ